MLKNKIAINGRFLTQRLTGVQRFAYQIVKHLLASGVEIVILVPPKPLFEGYDVQGWPIVRWGYWGGHLWEQISLPVFLNYSKVRGKHFILLNLCNTAPLLYHKNVLTLHDVSFIENPEWFKRTFVFCYKSVIPRLIKKALFVTTVSQFSKSIIEKYYPLAASKIEVIYNAPATLPPSSESTADHFLTKNNLKRNRYVLSVCSLEPRKNLNALVKAFMQLKEQDINLVLVGSKGNVFNKIALETNEDSRIKLMGYVADEELRVLYSNALCFVYPSLYEGFGLPPIEAMSNACPVIVSRIPSLQEVCEDAALYADPFNTDDILNKIETVLADPSLQEKMMAGGLSRASSFSWFKSAEKLACLLEEKTNGDKRKGFSNKQGRTYM